MSARRQNPPKILSVGVPSEPPPCLSSPEPRALIFPWQPLLQARHAAALAPQDLPLIPDPAERSPRSPRKARRPNFPDEESQATLCLLVMAHDKEQRWRYLVSLQLDLRLPGTRGWRSSLRPAGCLSRGLWV